MAEDFVKITVTSNVNAFHSDRTFPLSTTVSTLKCKLELLTGVPSSAMHLELRTVEGKFLCTMADNESNLNSYKIQNGMIIHVVGTSDLGTDDDKVEKFVISDEAYDKRSDSVRAFKLKQKLGEFDPEHQKKKELEAQKLQLEAEKAAQSIKVGLRCEVRLSKQPPRRGQIMFVGETSFKPGPWVGVQYDEPVGKHDGAVDGHRYFQCPAKYGSFVRPLDVVVGDFPEENLQEMDEF